MLHRFAQAVLVMAAMATIVFVGVYAIGNPVDVLIAPDADQQLRAATIAKYGLDQPLYIQCYRYFSRLLTGDFGQSFVFNIPVLQLISSRAPATFELALFAILFATFIGVPLGIYAGYRPNSIYSRIIMTFSIIGFSVPTFWIGLILILTFAVTLGWMPPGGRGETVSLLGVHWSFLTLDGLHHLALPALNLSLFKLALLIRLARAGTRELILSDQVRFARAAGVPDRVILSRHVLKAISIPIVTVFGLELGSTIAFAVVTETIFNWPGLGKLVIDSITNLDRPVLAGYLILVSAMFITINLIVDIAYALLDPRLKVGKAR